MAVNNPPTTIIALSDTRVAAFLLARQAAEFIGCSGPTNRVELNFRIPAADAAQAVLLNFHSADLNVNASKSFEAHRMLVKAIKEYQEQAQRGGSR